MPEKIYYFLSGMVLAILIAINVRSHGAYVSVMVIYAGLWVGVELVYGIICDIVEIVKIRKRSEEK